MIAQRRGPEQCDATHLRAPASRLSRQVWCERRTRDAQCCDNGSNVSTDDAPEDGVCVVDAETGVDDDVAAVAVVVVVGVVAATNARHSCNASTARQTNAHCNQRALTRATNPLPAHDPHQRLDAQRRWRWQTVPQRKRFCAETKRCQTRGDTRCGAPSPASRRAHDSVVDNVNRLATTSSDASSALRSCRSFALAAVLRASKHQNGTIARSLRDIAPTLQQSRL